MVTIKHASSPSKVDLLILGAGWTSTFLIPLLQSQNITHAATSTTGRPGTYKFRFAYDDEKSQPSDHADQYAALPLATTVLITFPLVNKGQSEHLAETYAETHGKNVKDLHFVQLGSSGIWSIPGQDLWVTRHSPYDKTDPRAIAEDELLSLGGCVLDLSGLWGGERHPRHWIDRVAGTKEVLSGKTTLHMVHGLDVARAVIAVHGNFGKAKGERWMLTDLMVYDWWALILGYAGEEDSKEREEKQLKWIGELMDEKQVRALPRSMEELGRCYDTREFWGTFGIMPTRSKL